MKWIRRRYQALERSWHVLLLRSLARLRPCFLSRPSADPARSCWHRWSVRSETTNSPCEELPLRCWNPRSDFRALAKPAADSNRANLRLDEAGALQTIALRHPIRSDTKMRSRSPALSVASLFQSELSRHADRRFSYPCECAAGLTTSALPAERSFELCSIELSRLQLAAWAKPLEKQLSVCSSTPYAIRL